MKLRSLACTTSLLAAATIHCGGSVVALGGSSQQSALAWDQEPAAPLLTTAKRIDILLAVDNSPSMSAKSTLLARSLRPFLTQVAALTGDVHVGVVTSSLGNQGGDVCDSTNPSTNQQAHLQTTGPEGATVDATGVLTYLDEKDGGDPTRFIDDAEQLVRGVGQTGCGLEMQLEAAYRFLVQPDPSDMVRLDPYNQGDLGEGIDVDVLAQRADFLRPDSLLLVLMLTDEDDFSIDPRSVGGQGWAFASKNFPGSHVVRGANASQGTTAPRATTKCATDPGDPDCTSCGFQDLCDRATATCLATRADPNCRASGVPGVAGGGYDGYYGANDDPLNVRQHRTKERFGVEPRFAIDRYVDGFTQFKVPDRNGEHVTTSEAGAWPRIAPYAGTPTCRNPIFAESLPRDPKTHAEICERKRGLRSPEMVFFGLLAGVPRALADVDTPSWPAIVGSDPDHYRFDGIDPHMIPSITARPGLGAPDGEWDTGGQDLQYACTFELETPVACQVNEQSCDCSPDRPTSNPLCGPTPGQQLRAKAYPTTRELRVAKGLGDRAVIGSVCAESSAIAYEPFMRRLGDRIRPRLVHH